MRVQAACDAANHEEAFGQKREKEPVKTSVATQVEHYELPISKNHERSKSTRLFGTKCTTEFDWEPEIFQDNPLLLEKTEEFCRWVSNLDEGKEDTQETTTIASLFSGSLETQPPTSWPISDADLIHEPRGLHAEFAWPPENTKARQPFGRWHAKYPTNTLQPIGQKGKRLDKFRTSLWPPPSGSGSVQATEMKIQQGYNSKVTEVRARADHLNNRLKHTYEYAAFMEYAKKGNKRIPQVFGLGNSAYPHFNACAKLVDRLLHRHGGTRLLQPVFSDELQDQERTFLTWQLQVTEAIRSRLHVMEAVNSNVPIRPLYQKMSVPRGALTGGKLFVGEPHTLGSYKYQKIPFNSKNPFLAKVIVNEELYNFTVRSCRHIELDIDGSSFSYRPGDHVAVLPSNPMALVESIGELLRINLDEPFALLSSETLNLRKSPFPCPCTYRTALTHYVDLTGPPSLRTLSALADFTENMLEAEQLRFFVSNTTDGQADDFTG
ncbi:unnamed protein product [Dicrocoelium dendriticum]|nr:unnamed protein product [Dicrocoelium dendriticum]